MASGWRSAVHARRRRRTFTVVIFTDATSQVRLKDTRDQLRALGLIDSATNLPGREVAMLHVEQAIAMAKRDKRSVGLLSLKLDRFHSCARAPDGSAAAEEVVRQFAKRITAFVRASDVPARLADDSFLVVLTALTTRATTPPWSPSGCFSCSRSHSTSSVTRGRCTAASASRSRPETRPMRSRCSARRSRRPTGRRSSAAALLRCVGPAAADGIEPPTDEADASGPPERACRPRQRASADRTDRSTAEGARESHALPAASSSTTTTTTGSAATTAAEATATTAARRGGDRGRDLAGERAEIARQVIRGERAERAARVPARGRLRRVDVLERVGPLLDAAEHDRVRQVFGEDVLASAKRWRSFSAISM